MLNSRVHRMPANFRGGRISTPSSLRCLCHTIRGGLALILLALYSVYTLGERNAAFASPPPIPDPGEQGGEA